MGALTAVLENVEAELPAAIGTQWTSGMVGMPLGPLHEKFLRKLWETLVNNGLATLWEPTVLERRGRAQAEVERHHMLRLAQAEKELDLVRKGQAEFTEDGKLIPVMPAAESLEGAAGDNALPEPHRHRRGYKSLAAMVIANAGANAALRQVRVERIANEAFHYAEQEEPTNVSDEPVDTDWLEAWRSHAERTTSEQLRGLWARVLAGEVREPGTCSIRTINFISSMSKREAKIIEFLAHRQVSGFVILDATAEHPRSIYVSPEKDLMSDVLTERERLFLSEWGVWRYEGRTKQFSISEVNPRMSIRCGRLAIIFFRRSADVQFAIHGHLLTEIGLQLMAFCICEQDEVYMTKLAQLIGSKVDVNISLVDVHDGPGGTATFDNVRIIQGDDPRSVLE